MPRPPLPIHIYDLEIDDDNERHMIEEHRVYADDLYEVLDRDFTVVENEGDHEEEQPYAIIGTTVAGRPTVHTDPSDRALWYLAASDRF